MINSGRSDCFVPTNEVLRLIYCGSGSCPINFCAHYLRESMATAVFDHDIIRPHFRSCNYGDTWRLILKVSSDKVGSFGAERKPLRSYEFR